MSILKYRSTNFRGFTAPILQLDPLADLNLSGNKLAMRDCVRACVRVYAFTSGLFTLMNIFHAPIEDPKPACCCETSVTHNMDMCQNYIKLLITLGLGQTSC